MSEGTDSVRRLVIGSQPVPDQDVVNENNIVAEVPTATPTNDIDTFMIPQSTYLSPPVKALPDDDATFFVRQSVLPPAPPMPPIVNARSSESPATNVSSSGMNGMRLTVLPSSPDEPQESVTIKVTMEPAVVDVVNHVDSFNEDDDSTPEVDTLANGDFFGRGVDSDFEFDMTDL